MKQLPTLSIECFRCLQPKRFENTTAGVELCCPLCPDQHHLLTPVEVALLSLIMDRQERVDAPVTADHDGWPGYLPIPDVEDEPAHAELALEIVAYVSSQSGGSRWWDHMHEGHQGFILDGVTQILKKAITP